MYAYLRKRKLLHAARVSFWAHRKCVNFVRTLLYLVEALRQTTPWQVKQPVDSISVAEDPQEDICSEQTYYSIDADTLPGQVPRHPESIIYDTNILSATRPTCGLSLQSIRQFSSMGSDDGIVHSESAFPHDANSANSGEAHNRAEPREDFEPILTSSFARETARGR